MAKSIRGIVPILAAPFTAAGALDEDSLRTLVRHLAATGANALTLFGDRLGISASPTSTSTPRSSSGSAPTVG